jgi:hypothetical protein
MEGRDETDPLFIQMKEAAPSVLEEHLRKSPYPNHGQRVVMGQRQMQASPDIFLGWVREGSHHYYLRQLQDMKGVFDLEDMHKMEMFKFATMCGWTLARAHARSGDRIQLASYLGGGTRFERAMADFAETYADVNERDYCAFMKAIEVGRLRAQAG